MGRSVKLNNFYHIVMMMMRAAITPLLRVPQYFAQEHLFLYLSLAFLADERKLSKFFLPKYNY